MSRGEIDRGVVLIGLRASGKTTVGGLLSARLGVPFVDLDERTTAVLHCESVREAFSLHGERMFRQAEVSALREVLLEGARVLALGGGTAMVPAARGLLGEFADGLCVVYLRASPACLRQRLASGGAGDRPSLTGRGVLEEIEEIYEQRDPIYREIADAVIEVDGTTADACARRVEELLGASR